MAAIKPRARHFQYQDPYPITEGPPSQVHGYVFDKWEICIMKSWNGWVGWLTCRADDYEYEEIEGATFHNAHKWMRRMAHTYFSI